MTTLLAFPILITLLIVQTAILSNITLLHGTTDVVFLAIIAWTIQRRVDTGWVWGIIGGLLVGYVSAVPIPVYLFAYLGSVGVALLLRQRIWNVPFLAMLIVTFTGTILLQGSTLIALRIANTPLALEDTINLIALPGLVLNLILALPFFLIFGDLAKWLYPEPLEI
ncbi:MAG: rod shape-determining protein MreD [Anaerolineae bacterium UTCFX2]|jgi:rod shape-determining protein MreD|nr:rod shape-determining protein MreD [Anaerolineales bacterium]OQY90926.1 MAG: rod shape-determining protein MreD [Anaerolineae bacterium UTCFX2]